MKITFDLTDHDDCLMVQNILKLNELNSNLDEIYRASREQLKYGDCENKEQLIQTLERIKQMSFRE